MKFVSAIFLFGFVAIAVFGFAAADYGNHERCIVAIAQGASLCHDSALDFVVFHIGTLKSFSLAILSMFASIAAFVALILFFIAPWLNNDNGAFPAEFFLKYLLGKFSPPIKLKISRWLALCEKRDPSLIF